MQISTQYDASNMTKRKDPMSEKIRQNLQDYAKDFKVSWIALGQNLFTVYRDKMFHAWGFEKFEDYVVGELGLSKAMALKIVKNYAFVETEEPVYLKEDFYKDRDTVTVPGLEHLDVLRLAHRNRELDKNDYNKIRKDIFEKGKDPAAIKKDLTALMRERKEVDPDEEREVRHEASVRRFLTALKTFKKDMDALKLIEPDILDEATKLLQVLEGQYKNQ